MCFKRKFNFLAICLVPRGTEFTRNFRKRSKQPSVDISPIKECLVLWYDWCAFRIQICDINIRFEFFSHGMNPVENELVFCRICIFVTLRKKWCCSKELKKLLNNLNVLEHTLAEGE